MCAVDMQELVSGALLRPRATSSQTLRSLGGRFLPQGRKSPLPGGAPRSWPRAQVGRGEGGGLSRAGRRSRFVLAPDRSVLVQQSRLSASAGSRGGEAAGGARPSPQGGRPRSPRPGWSHPARRSPARHTRPGRCGPCCQLGVRRRKPRETRAQDLLGQGWVGRRGLYLVLFGLQEANVFRLVSMKTSP